MNIYELSARFDARQSFYGKAHVIEHDDGTLELLSYETIVARCKDGKVERIPGVRSSQTTRRHIREFEKQFAR